MTSTAVDIVFEAGSFQAGDKVSGQVVLRVSQELSVTGIEARLSGICQIECEQRKWWNIVKNRVMRREPPSPGYRTETIIKKDMVLLGIAGDTGPTLPNSVTAGAIEYDPSKYNITVHHLAEGDHIYPFSLHLPHNIPGSFRTDKGDSILYDITVTIRRQLLPPIVVSKNIHVDCVLNLNSEPELLKPVLSYKELQIGPPCCASGYISGEFRLAKRGAVSGEQLLALCEIDNKSSIPIQDVHIVIRKYVTTFGPGGRRLVKDICKLKLGIVGSQDKKVWENVKLSLPTDMVPGKHWCKTMVVKHVAVLVANPLHWPWHLEVPIQLYVATVQYSQSSRAHYRSLVKLNSTSSYGGSRRCSAIDNGTPSGVTSVPMSGTPHSNTLKSTTRKSISSLCSYREALPRMSGPKAQDIVTALQRVRKHARAESLGNPTYDSISGRRNSGIGPLEGYTSRRGTMSSQGGGTLPRKQPYRLSVTKSVNSVNSVNSE